MRLYLSVLPCVCLLCKDRGCLDNLHISIFYLPVDLWLTCIFCICVGVHYAWACTHLPSLSTLKTWSSFPPSSSWVIFILNARKLVSLSFYAPLSGFYLPFTSRALFLPLLLALSLHPFIRAVWEWSCQWGDERLQSGVFITDTHKHIGCPTSASVHAHWNECMRLGLFLRHSASVFFFF